jgi:hypothetical protein
MKRASRRTRQLPAAAIAIITILAMLLTPLCGIRCAATNHCSVQVPLARASDDCHHFAISNDSDTAWADFTVAKNCAQPDFLAVTPTATNNSPSWRAARTSPLQLPAMAARPNSGGSVALNRAAWFDLSGTLPSADPLARSAVLQI